MPRDPKNPRALPEQSEWTFDLIEQAHEEIRRVARKFGLDTYPNQLEIITAEQMMDAYTSVGMPVSYNHWSFGKHFLTTEKSYRRGQMGLAYEIVINSNPCIAYLMEENSLTMQALVIAHAAYGHNSFFKGNYLFRTWTDADAIVDYMVFAKNYIAECEQRHGIDAVEELLDSCHAIQNYGVDRYKRPAKLSVAQEARARRSARNTCSRRSTSSGAPCRGARKPGKDQPPPPLPARARGKPALLYREVRAAAGTLAARAGAHHAQDLAVLLSAAPDPGDERGLGHLLALHDPAGTI
jgi:stage V sporulation protein R